MFATKTAGTRVLAMLLALAPLAACGGGSQPDGLYVMTRFWPGTGSLEIAGYLFRDGVVVRNPIGPSDAIDAQAERAAHAKDVGTYAREGDTLVMRFDGGEDRGAMEIDGDCFAFDGGTFCPVEPVGDGAALDGTYSGGASVSGYGGRGSASTTITFADDGRYVLASAGSVSTTSAGSTASVGGSGDEAGTYRFDGTALYLTPEGGSERAVSTFAYDDGTDGARPRRLFFGGTMLKRAD